MPSAEAKIAATGSSGDSPLAQALARYAELQEQGQAPSPQDFAAQHPQVATELLACLQQMEWIGQVADDLSHGLLAGELTDPDSGPPKQRVLGDYQIRRQIGRGGMGVVYEAEQISLGRRVALKILAGAGMLDPRSLARFKNEVQAAASLDHPHIVDVIGVGCERGIHYYAMRLIDGRTLAEVLDAVQQQCQDDVNYQPSSLQDMVGVPPSGGKRNVDWPAKAGTPTSLPAETLAKAASKMPRFRPDYFRSIAEIGIQAAEALDHAHDEGVIHRDIKPSNLMLDSRGKLWVTDFGLARIESAESMTITGDLVGTLRYMSPEQALAKRAAVDHRTDVYSLGATLYELLTLRPLIEAADREEVLNWLRDKEPVPLRRIAPQLPVDVETVVLKCLAKEPGERYATAKELAEDLRRAVKNEPIRAKRPDMRQRMVRGLKRHPAVMGSLTAILFVTCLATLTSLTLISRANTRLNKANKQANRSLAESMHILNEIYDVMQKYRSSNAQMNEVHSVIAPYAAKIRENDYETEPDVKIEILWLRAWESGMRIMMADEPQVREEAIAARVQVLAEISSEAIKICDHYPDNDRYSHFAAKCLLNEMSGFPGQFALSSDYWKDKDVFLLLRQLHSRAEERHLRKPTSAEWLLVLRNVNVQLADAYHQAARFDDAAKCTGDAIDCLAKLQRLQRAEGLDDWNYRYLDQIATQCASQQRWGDLEMAARVGTQMQSDLPVIRTQSDVYLGFSMVRSLTKAQWQQGRIEDARTTAAGARELLNGLRAKADAEGTADKGTFSHVMEQCAELCDQVGLKDEASRCRSDVREIGKSIIAANGIGLIGPTQRLAAATLGDARTHFRERRFSDAVAEAKRAVSYTELAELLSGVALQAPPSPGLVSQNRSLSRATDARETLSYFKYLEMREAGDDKLAFEFLDAMIKTPMAAVGEILMTPYKEAELQNELAFDLLFDTSNEKWNDPNYARRLCLAAVSRIREKGIFWATLGIAQYRCAEFGNAEKSLCKAIQLRGRGEPQEWFYLAMAFYHNGEYANAVECFEMGERTPPPPTT